MRQFFVGAPSHNVTVPENQDQIKALGLSCYGLFSLSFSISSAFRNSKTRSPAAATTHKKLKYVMNRLDNGDNYGIIDKVNFPALIRWRSIVSGKEIAL